jgi:hypothetical protein
VIVLIIVCSFCFGHCIVCPSIYGSWLPLWYLQTLFRSVCFGHCIVSFNLRLLITALVSSNSSPSFLFRSLYCLLFRSLHCLSFNLRLLFTPLLSSHSSPFFLYRLLYCLFFIFKLFVYKFQFATLLTINLLF